MSSRALTTASTVKTIGIEDALPNCVCSFCCAAAFSSLLPWITIVWSQRHSNRRSSLCESSEGWLRILSMLNGRRTSNPSREVAQDAITYGGSVPLQLLMSMIACDRVRPCALWVVMANAGRTGTWVREILHCLWEYGWLNLSFTVFSNATNSPLCSCGRLSHVVSKEWMMHDRACRFLSSSTVYRTDFRIPWHPLTIPPSTSKLWPTMIGIPITNGIFPRRWLVNPECRLLRCVRNNGSVIFLPAWESEQWYQCNSWPVWRAKSAVAWMLKASFTSLLLTITGASLQPLSQFGWTQDNQKEKMRDVHVSGAARVI